MPSEQDVRAAIDLHRPPNAAPLLPPVVAPSVETIVTQALQEGRTGQELQELLAFARELRKDRAYEAFVRAFNAFQAECPRIAHNRTAEIASRSGRAFNYTYPDMDHIQAIVNPILRRHGFALNFGDVRVDGAGDSMMLTETAILSHIEGVQRTASFTCSVRSASPAMTPQQVFGNASTYCQRRALGKLLGIHTGEPDTDGAGDDAPSGPITPEQADEITRLVERTKSDWSLFYQWAGVANLAELPAAKYGEAVRMLQAKATRLGVKQ